MGIIKSVQQGTIQIPVNLYQADTTINAVNLDSTLLLFMGLFIPGGANIEKLLTRIQFVDATTVRAIRLVTDATHTPSIGFAVVEFEPTTINSVQSGVIEFAAGETDKTALIASVDLNKSIIAYLGHGATTSSNLFPHDYARLELDDNTHVRAVRWGTMGLVDIGYSVVEAI